MESPKPAVDLESELTCPVSWLPSHCSPSSAPESLLIVVQICAELLYQPLTLLDCLHTFCGACLKVWFSWQATAAENAPSPPAPGTPVFTCPACRATVRDTRHNATVATLLDMLLKAQPDKQKPEDERREMDARYKHGDPVLPKLNIAERSPEQLRLDEHDRRLIDEVRAMSLREAVAGHSQSRPHSERRAESRTRTSRSRTAPASRDQSRDRHAGHNRERDRRQTAAADASRLRTEQGAALQPESSRAGEQRRPHRTGSRQPSADSADSRQRHVEHQSSLRSLIGSTNNGSSDIEREIEEFARQIQDEGLLDGLDLENVDLNNNDELTRRIAEAYRRRHRERSRHDGARRSGASGASRNSDSGPTEPRPRAGESSRSSRPSSRPRSHTHSNASRSPSATGQPEERNRYPPSSSSHLEVREEPQRHRRRTSSEGRSATVPIAPSQPPARVGARSQTDLSLRPAAAESPSAAAPAPSGRPSAFDGRSSSSPVVPSTAQMDSSARILPFSARMPVTSTPPSTSAARMPGVSTPPSTSAARMPGISTPPSTSAARMPGMSTPPSTGAARMTAASTPPSTGSAASESLARRGGRPPDLDLVMQANFASSPVADAGPRSPPMSSPGHQRKGSQFYKEPSISCSRCSKEHIEYDVHYHCATCSAGTWNICLDCYRAGKGCLHWFGFGQAAWQKWENARRAGEANLAEPHMLTAGRYLPPRTTPGGADGRRVLTAENPMFRLQTGTFCMRCFAWTNDCYWRCVVCNEGDWGFCNDCVNQGRCCTHPLMALAHQPSQPHTPPSSPGSAGRPQAASVSTGIDATNIGSFKALTFTKKCDVCHIPIPPSQHRYHCYSCPSSAASDPKPGDYDICQGCYGKLAANKSISPDNGPSGWRRCLQGHRMVVVGFHDGHAGKKRYVAQDLVGGRSLKIEPAVDSGTAASEQGGAAGVQRWYIEHDKERTFERLVPKDVRANMAPTAGADAFPPDGGLGFSAVAKWAWFPAAEAEDELLFPKAAEIREIQDVNGEWFHGVYMGAKGLFPSGYVKALPSPV